MKKVKYFLAIVFVGIVYAVSVYFYKPYDAMYRQSGGDAFGYYVYLPAFFIHHDLPTLHNTMAAKYKECSPGVKADSSYFNKYCMGTAVMQAPFFLAAHLWARFIHQPRDGFSMPYMYAVQMSCVVYSLLALLFISLILRRQFSGYVVIIVVLIIGLCTNLYYLVVFQAPFCHAYLLFLYSILIYFTIRFYDSFRRRYIIFIGLVCGMIVLTRLNELYVVLIPVLWGIRGRADINKRLRLLRRFAPTIIGAICLMALCLVPQMIYWKLSTGHYLYYSYQGEKFDFLHPRIMDGLFGFTNGWLVYCPVMVLALVGIWAIAWHKDASFAPLIVFLPIHIYVIYSWWCWFYMGSYGSRPMTETYALLSIPLAYSVDWCLRSLIRRLFLGIVFFFCTWLLMFQTYQSSLDIFNSELCNWHFYLTTFGKTKLTYDESVVLDTKEFQPRHPQFDKMLGENKFDEWGMPDRDSSGHASVCLHQGQVLMGYAATLMDAGVKPGQWIKASIDCMAKIPTNHNWHLSSLVMAFTRKGKMTKWSTVSLENKIENPEHVIWHFTINKWGRVYFYSQIPHDMTAMDTISVYLENKHLGPDIYVSDLKVELYNER